MQGYWFNDYIGWEEKQTRTNRLILSFRYHGEKPKKAVVYVDHLITIPTKHFHYSDKKTLDKIVRNCKDDEDLGNYNLRFILSEKNSEEDYLRGYGCEVAKIKGDYNVAQITFKNNWRLFSKLSSIFQCGNYDKLIRMKLGYLNRKFMFFPQLEHAFEIKEGVDNLQERIEEIITEYVGDCSERKNRSKRTELINNINYFFNQHIRDDNFDVEEEIKNSDYRKLKEFLSCPQANEVIEIKREVNKMLRRVKDLVTSQDKKNGVIYDKENLVYNIKLHSLKGIFPYKRLSADEIRDQVWLYIDTENPLYKTEEELELLGERRDILKKLNGDIDLEKQLKGIEERLTIDVGGIKARLWEEKYKDRISIINLLYKLQDGSFVREIHTLRNPNHEEKINDYSIYTYNSDFELYDGLVASLKKYKPFITIAHNAPHDILKIREEAKGIKTKNLDIDIKGKLPVLTVSRDQIYRRLLIFCQDVIDTWRLGVVFHTYLKTNMPKGSHKLEDLANHVVPEFGFKKAFSYKELRDLEIRAINGDTKAVRSLLEYSTMDVEVLKAIMEKDQDKKQSYLDSLVMVQDLMPHVSLTEVAFSPNSVRGIYDWNHWAKSNNQLNFAYEGKRSFDEFQIFKKRFAPWKREKLISVVDVSTKRGLHKNVAQLYLPLEELIKNAIFIRFPEWKGICEKLSGLNHVKQFGLLQYLDAFAMFGILEDYYQFTRELRGYNAVREIGLNPKEVDELFIKYEGCLKNRNKLELLDSYFGAYDFLKNLYRSFYYVSLESMEDREKKNFIRKVIRVQPKIKVEEQLKFGFENLYYRENLDLENLKDLADHILKEEKEYVELKKILPKQSLKDLKAFRSIYHTLNQTFKELVDAVREDDINQGISAENLVYLYNQKWRAKKKKRAFIGAYGLSPEFDKEDLILGIEDKGDKSLEEIIKSSIKNLGEEIKRRGLIVIKYKENSDYLFVIGKDLDFSNSNFKLIRIIPEFFIEDKKDIERDELLMPLMLT